jgi:hypothetical protein
MTPEGMKAVLDGGSNVQKRYTVFATSSGIYHPTWHEQTADQPSLKQLLQSRGLSVLVAPHHGLESCYSSDLFAAIASNKPRINIISERRKTREGDGCTHACYQSEVGGSGLNVRIEGKQEFRRSVTTKAGHHILLEFSGSGAPVINLETSPEKLLAYA